MTRLKTLLVLIVGALLLSGCNFDVYKLPLPGGTDVGDNPITVTAEFRDVLDLVPKTAVKVNDVNVGQVTDISLEGQTAKVTMELRQGTHLPDNAVAEIRQTSLLGEKFVQLSPPTDTAPSSNPLASGDDIPLERTNRNPEVEEVLGALSLILNGGGVAQLQTINHELNLALEGHEDSARSVLHQIEDFVGQLDEHKQDVVDAIEALNRLSVTANQQMDSIDLALDKLPGALDTIDKQRGDLVKMLQALNHLGDVGVRVIKLSKESTIDSFRQLVPVLSQLEASGDNFVKAFNVFLTYPFVDEVVGRDPQVARNLHMGDYTNLSVQLDITVNGGGSDSPTLPTDLPSEIDPTVILDDVLKCIQSGDLSSKACQKVAKDPQKLLELQKKCKKKKYKDKDVCKQLNELPTLPNPSGSGPGLPSISLPGVGTVGRAPFGSDATVQRWGPRGPTMRQLMSSYDPALVALLVPGMVTQ